MAGWRVSLEIVKKGREVLLCRVLLLLRRVALRVSLQYYLVLEGLRGSRTVVWIPILALRDTQRKTPMMKLLVIKEQ